MCAACAGSGATDRDACTSRFVRMCVRLSVHGWGVVTVVDVRRVYWFGGDWS